MSHLARKGSEKVISCYHLLSLEQVTVPRTMRVVIVLRGMGVDWTSVRSIQEEPLANLQVCYFLKFVA